jgi:heme oxygenase
VTQRDVALELDKMKSSFANMLDLLMNELDAVKKDLYVDFGEAQKLIAEDIKQLLSDAKLHSLRLDALEKDRRAQLPAAGMRAAPDLEARVDYLESLVLRMETSSLKDSEKPRLTSNG